MPVWIFTSLVALTAWGSSQFLRKRATEQVSLGALIIFQTGTFMLFATAAVVIQGLEVSYEAAALAAAGGSFQFIGNISSLHALSRGPASVIVPFPAMYPVVTLVLSLLVLQESINSSQVVGLVLSLGALYAFSR